MDVYCQSGGFPKKNKTEKKEKKNLNIIYICGTFKAIRSFSGKCLKVHIFKNVIRAAIERFPLIYSILG